MKLSMSGLFILFAVTLAVVAWFRCESTPVIFPFKRLFNSFCRHWKESRSFPPGPPRFPLVGSLLSTGKMSSNSQVLMLAARWIPKYGKIMGLFVGPSFR